MKKTIYYSSLFVIISLIFFSISCRLPNNNNKNFKANDEQGFVIMELFTSQGCSSCPPADEILGRYALKNNEHIFPLAFHVDYWNRLGWVDSLSKNIYSQRQRDYAEKLNLESVYTPQIIINGQKQMVGSEEKEIASTTNKYLNEKAPIQISITGISLIKNKVSVNYQLSDLPLNMHINAALVQKKVVTQIKAGENRGVKLDNYNVVRDFKTTELLNVTGNFVLDLPYGNYANNYKVILFVQDKKTGSIQAAAGKDCQ